MQRTHTFLWRGRGCALAGGSAREGWAVWGRWGRREGRAKGGARVRREWRPPQVAAECLCGPRSRARAGRVRSAAHARRRPAPSSCSGTTCKCARCRVRAAQLRGQFRNPLAPRQTLWAVMKVGNEEKLIQLSQYIYFVFIYIYIYLYIYNKLPSRVCSLNGSLLKIRNPFSNPHEKHPKKVYSSWAYLNIQYTRTQSLQF